MSAPSIILYCNHLLYPSETFILEQGEAMQTFEPHYFGMRRVRGLSMPEGRTHVINEGTRRGWIAEALFAFTGASPKLSKRVRAIRPALIHGHFGPDGLRALPLAMRAKLPLVVTFHGSDVMEKDSHASNRPQKQFVKSGYLLQEHGTLFIAVSHFIEKKLIERGYPPERVRVQYIGVNTRKFRPSESVAREKVVLFVGRLHEVKGCKYLIDAMARVQANHPDFRLVIVGDGSLRRELEIRAAEKLKAYEFVGAQSQEQVRLWMQRAYIFCAPSIVAESGNTEAFGMVFAEAQASGLPVVSFASGGVGEAVAHGSTGFLALERDSEKLAEYINALIENKQLWTEFSRAGQLRVRQLFDLSTRTRELEAIYQSITERRKGAGA